MSSTGKAVVVPISSEYVGIDFILRGFNPDGSQNDIELIISAYIGNGTDIIYLSRTYGNTPEVITFENIKNQ